MVAGRRLRGRPVGRCVIACRDSNRDRVKRDIVREVRAIDDLDVAHRGLDRSGHPFNAIVERLAQEGIERRREARIRASRRDEPGWSARLNPGGSAVRPRSRSQPAAGAHSSAHERGLAGRRSPNWNVATVPEHRELVVMVNQVAWPGPSPQGRASPTDHTPRHESRD
jgi:hypothetical protein